MRARDWERDGEEMEGERDREGRGEVKSKRDGGEEKGGGEGRERGDRLSKSVPVAL